MMLTIAGYLFVLMLVGTVLVPKNLRGRDYFVASRNAPGVLVGVSLFATSIGGSSLFVTADLIGRFGAGGVVLEVGGALGLVTLGLFIAPRIRRTEVFTLAGVLKRTFGSPTARYAAGLLAVAEILWFTLLMKSVEQFSIPSHYIYVVFAVVILYTSMGGQWAVIGTDALQTFLIVLGMGYLTLLHSLSYRATILSISPDIPLALLVLMFLAHVAGPDMYSRVLSARSPRAARDGCFIAAAGKILWGMMMVAVLSNSSFEGSLPGYLSSIAPSLSWMVNLVLLSVIISSADTVLMSSTTFLHTDVLKKKYSPGLSRITTMMVGLTGMLVYSVSGSLIELFTQSYSFFTGAFVAPVLLCMMPGRARHHHSWLMILAMSAGGTVGIFLNSWTGLGVSCSITLLSFLFSKEIS